MAVDGVGMDEIVWDSEAECNVMRRVGMEWNGCFRISYGMV